MRVDERLYRVASAESWDAPTRTRRAPTTDLPFCVGKFSLKRRQQKVVNQQDERGHVAPFS
eukprot:7289675-Prymnesium_polylepis.2